MQQEATNLNCFKQSVKSPRKKELETLCIRAALVPNKIAFGRSLKSELLADQSVCK